MNGLPYHTDALTTDCTLRLCAGWHPAPVQIRGPEQVPRRRAGRRRRHRRRPGAAVGLGDLQGQLMGRRKCYMSAVTHSQSLLALYILLI